MNERVLTTVLFVLAVYFSGLLAWSLARYAKFRRLRFIGHNVSRIGRARPIRSDSDETHEYFRNSLFVMLCKSGPPTVLRGGSSALNTAGVRSFRKKPLSPTIDCCTCWV